MKDCSQPCPTPSSNCTRVSRAARPSDRQQDSHALVSFWRVALAEHLMKLSMEELVEFLQETLSKNFFFDDDFVVEQLQASMTELRRAKLDLPAPGTDTQRQQR